MSARKGSICRVTAPVPRVDRLAVSSEPTATERPLLGVLEVVWRGRWIMAACLAVALSIGYYRMSKVVPVYGAFAKLVLQQSTPSVLGDPLAGGTQSAGYLYTQCEIIHSSAILTKALTEPGVADASCLKGVTAPVTFLKTAVVAGADQQGELIEIKMESPNPQDAATIVNGVVAAYISYLSEQHQSTAVEVMKILQKRAEEEKNELNKQQLLLADFKKANPELALSADKGKGINAMFSAQYTEARGFTFELKCAIDEAEHFKDDPYTLKAILDRVNLETKMPQVSDPVVNPMYEAQREELEQALVKVGPGNERYPVVEAEQRQLAHLVKEIKLEQSESAEKYQTMLDREYQAAQQREASLKQVNDQERGKAFDINSKEAEYDQLVDQTQNTSRDLDMLYDRMKTVNVNEEVGGLTARVLEPAVASFESIGNGRTKIMGMALVIGLMAGLGGSLLRDMIDHRFRSVEEISRFLALPILGAVPQIKPGGAWALPDSLKDMLTHWRRYLSLPAVLVGNRNGKLTHHLMECGQAMHLQPRSDVAEAYRTIRTAIYFGLSGLPAKTILITSPASGDGKTTVASNLAIAIAQAGRRVLLIDADCWRPAVHDIFGLSNDIGLTSILLKKSTLVQAVRKTDVDNLDVLPCGECPSNPAELLESQALVDLLAEASEQYDQILIDSPPVVPITDARILAASCGATMLVLRAGKSTRNQADDAFEALAAVGAPILGLVVNNVVSRAHSKSYQYYRYTTDRANRWNNYEQNGNGQPRSNGHSRHLAGPIVDAEEVIDDDV